MAFQNRKVTTNNMTFSDGGSVQKKIECVFESRVVQEPSLKRSHQQFRIVGTDQIRQSALDASIEAAHPTEKLDGTCVYVETYEGEPWLWARHDRKPTKVADRNFKKFQASLRAWQAGDGSGERPVYKWDVQNDFKDVPLNWIPASKVCVIDGVLQPDGGGHIFGWVPVDPKSRTHVWHASTVDLEVGLALVIRPIEGKHVEEHCLEITIVPLKDLQGSTLELIGTNVNANPYKLGSKEHPVHFLVQHGSIPLDPTQVIPDKKALLEWFAKPEGQVEGIVWQCKNGQLFKVHRHHVNLPWPVDGSTALLAKPVTVNINTQLYDFQPEDMLATFRHFHGQMFESLWKLNQVIMSNHE